MQIRRIYDADPVLFDLRYSPQIKTSISHFHSIIYYLIKKKAPETAVVPGAYRINHLFTA